MKAAGVLFTLAMLLSLSFAQSTGMQASAHFSSNSTSLNPSSLLPISSVQSFMTPDGFYYERMGQYTVFAGNNSSGVYLTLSGSGADFGSLWQELNWLSATGALNNTCPPEPDENSTSIIYNGTTYCEIGVMVCSGDACPQSQAIAGTRGAAVPPAYDTSEKQSSPAYPAPSPDSEAFAMRVTSGAPNQPASEPPAPGITVTPDQVIQLFVAFLAVIVASYLILTHRQETLQIEPQDIRLLENETRAGIMEELSAADKIPTDLSNRLGKSKATIVEHLEALSDAGLVEKLATPGKKFVYYRLTHKGKIVLLKKAA